MNLEELKNIPITDVAARLGIEISRNGKSLCFKGHNKTPSLSFNLRKNFFKCFGCNIGGTTIDLVKDFMNISTSDSIRWLCREYNFSENLKGKKMNENYMRVVKPSQLDSKQTQKSSGNIFFEVYRYFLNLLDSAEAVQYLEKRGIQSEITKRAGIKVIPKDSRSIKENLKKTFGDETLKKAGIIAESKTGNLYFVFFKHRLIIPYFNIDGNIVNLQGRNIDSEDEPKYRLLSGIDTGLYNIQCINNIKKGESIYICEGAIDTLSALQLGLKNPIGIAGVHNFKDESFDFLYPYKVIVASDSDIAGRSFYVKICKEYLKRNKEIYRLDFEKLKTDYNVNNAKDLNDIARHADYKHFENSTRISLVYSHLLDDTYTEQVGGIQFDKGVFYSTAELSKLDGASDNMLKATYLIKKFFKGEIQ
jgi:DNA primase catalytic core